MPAEAFRPLEPGGIPPGDPFAVASVMTETERADIGTVSTPRVSIAYRPSDDMFLYSSYAEGFTSGAIINDGRLPAPYEIGPEVVATKEIGLRSDWLDARLRFNATLFDSRWDGLRVSKLIDDPNNPSLDIAILTSDGVAQARGLELKLFYLPGERWELDLALGLLDTEYLDIGDPPANGTGLQPGTPFAYAPETTYSLGARYRWPLTNGGELLFAGDYGWMGEYQREPANQNQPKNPDGSNKPEPAYGLLNARVAYQPANRNWQLSLFGTNLTNEWYVNGGTDVSSLLGVDFRHARPATRDRRGPQVLFRLTRPAMRNRRRTAMPSATFETIRLLPEFRDADGSLWPQPRVARCAARALEHSPSDDPPPGKGLRGRRRA